ncbi:MAG: ArsR/SmtB family transcription factor [Janthinobacterium lividum]
MTAAVKSKNEDRALLKPLSLEKVLHALGDPIRLEIVLQLEREGESSCAALDGGRPKSTMSHQFRVLREAGLVQTRNQGVTHMNTLCRQSLEAAFPGLLDVILAAAGDRSKLVSASKQTASNTLQRTS